MAVDKLRGTRINNLLVYGTHMGMHCTLLNETSGMKWWHCGALLLMFLLRIIFVLFLLIG